MKHAYLSEISINDALQSHAITVVEAEKLMKKVDFQVVIFKSINK